MTLVPRLARAGVPRVDSFLQERPLRHTPRAAVALSPRAVRAAGLVAPALTGGLLALHVVDAPWVALVPAVVAAVIAVPLAFAKLGNKRALPVDALGPLGILAAAVAIGVALAGPSSPFVLLLLAVSTALGALVPGRRLALALPACAAALTGAFAFANADASTMVADAVVLLGFGMLGRALFFGTLFAVRIREEARVDGELLKLYDDARLFGLMGTAEEGDDSAADKRLAAQTLAARDGSYRVLRLGARALKPDAAALYLLDNSGKELVLKEQLLDVDGPLVPRFSASAGAPGLALKRGQAVRLVDADGPAVQVHRRGAKSVLCAPLRGGSVLRGVVVFDRSHADLFSDDDEGVALALCEELVALLRTERVLERLDGEHKKIGRIFMAARAFGGVVRVDEAMEHTLTAALDLAPHASAAVVEIVRSPAGAAPRLRVRKVAGPDAAALACDDELVVDESAWVGRAILQRTALPHISSATSGAQERGLYAHSDGRTRSLGDVRAIPLFSQGEAVACLVVAVPVGEKLRAAITESLLVCADLAGVAVGGARLFETVEHSATTDGLTGLYNRRTLDAKLHEAVSRARRLQTPLCAVLVDVDHFKSVNDTYGHSVGDDVLKAIATALASTARTSDVVARYGGEEICAVLEGTDLAGAVRLAERMRIAVRELRFDTEKGPLSVTASFGVGVLGQGDDSRAVLEKADGGLYKAKQTGRDRVVSLTAPVPGS